MSAPEKSIEQQLKEAKAEVVACLKFMECELGWEWFRSEMFHADNPESTSSKNAQKLSDYLARTGHGLEFLRRVEEIEAESQRLKTQAANPGGEWPKAEQVLTI